MKGFGLYSFTHPDGHLALFAVGPCVVWDKRQLRFRGFDRSVSRYIELSFGIGSILTVGFAGNDIYAAKHIGLALYFKRCIRRDADQMEIASQELTGPG